MHRPSLSAPASPGSSARVHRLCLEPNAAPLDAPGDQTVLATALQAGIELHSSCRNGSCRACIRQLASGQVRYRIDWPGLSAEEKTQGFILPCVAYPLTDLVMLPAS